MHTHWRSFHTPNPFASRCALCDARVDSYQLTAHLRLHCGFNAQQQLRVALNASADDVLHAYTTHLRTRGLNTEKLLERTRAPRTALDRLAALSALLQRQQLVGVEFLQLVGVEFLPTVLPQRPLPFVEIESGYMW